jgi:hypothetical protein
MSSPRAALLGAILAAAWLAGAAPAHAGPKTAANASAPDQLEPGVPAEIFVAPGRATTVLLRSEKKVAAISLASPIITYKYDKALNQIEIAPAVRAGGGETNLNLRIGDEIYVLLVRVVTDVRAEFVRAFRLPDESAASDESQLGSVRPLAPAQIDLVAAAQTIEKAEHDAVFRSAQNNLRWLTIGLATPWNDCSIVLDTLVQFVDLDLIVFRVRWANVTRDALYLDARQYRIRAAGQAVPIVARYSPNEAVVLPGESVVVYLAVQGLKLSRHNSWQLELPPPAEAVSAIARGEVR